jgi:hypothetical protein
MNSLATNVLEIVRGGSPALDDMPRPFSVSEVLESVHEIVDPIAEKRDLTFKVVTPREDHRLGHPQALRRVLLNLATNAFKFTDQGFVEIAARSKSLTLIEFSVRDTGSGIPQEDLENLYEPFHTRGGGGLTFSGTGLGLTISRRLVTAMGSKLNVETGSWGTQFSFELDLPLATGVPEGARESKPRLRRAGKYTAVAASVLILATATTFAWQRWPLVGGHSESQTQELGASPTAPSVLEERSRLSGEPGVVTEGSAVQKEITDVPAKTEGTAKTDAEVTAGEAADAAPARLAPAHLFVNSVPWGSVYIDGVRVGHTPMLNLRIAPGTHTLRIERDGFEAYERVVELKSGEELRLTNVALTPREQ